MDEKFLDLTKMQIIGLIGGILLIIGCFMPVFTATVLATTISLTFMSIKGGLIGISVIVLALIGIFLVIKKWITAPQIIGSAILIILIYVLLIEMSLFTSMASNGAVGALAVGMLGYGFGWFFLFFGSILLIIMPYTYRQEKEIESSEEIDKLALKVNIATITICAVVLLLIIGLTF